jgi:hypothetical protein
VVEEEVIEVDGAEVSELEDDLTKSKSSPSRHSADTYVLSK